MLGKFFDPFIFEELPALDNSASQVYLREVSQCHIYIGLIGTKYGFKPPDGISPTEAEYDEATKLHKTRFIFLTSHEADERDESVNRFIDKIQSEIIRHRFLELSGLIKGVYESLLRYLEEKGYIQSGPFDAQLDPYATLEDIDQTKIYNFVNLAKSRRGFALDESHPVEKILHHLHLMRKEQISKISANGHGKGLESKTQPRAMKTYDSYKDSGIEWKPDGLRLIEFSIFFSILSIKTPYLFATNMVYFCDKITLLFCHKS